MRPAFCVVASAIVLLAAIHAAKGTSEMPEFGEVAPVILATEVLADSYDHVILKADVSAYNYVQDVVEEPDPHEVEMLACVIYQEAGGDLCSDQCRYMVGDVVLNRIADARFPDTMEMVLTQERQFGRFHWTGIVWPDRASTPGEAAAVQRAYDTARALLSGEHSEIYGSGYVWQAEFEQGADIIEIDGMYFGR